MMITTLMIKLLAEKYDGILCEENYHDRYFPDVDRDAVPTSVGYGSSFEGLSALLSMMNSCASGVSVVNIDNGFGAGYLASMINHMEVKK